MIALKNFLHTLRRYKAATLLNILGLAVAFAAFYILMVQVRFDLNFDRSYPKAECIYQIALPQFYEEGKGYSSFIPRPDGEKAIAASPHIRQGGCKNTMGISETSLYDPEQGSSAGLNRHPVYQISHGLLEVFGFRCIEGSFARFEEPNTVILSQKTARALYGGKSAVGRSLVFNDDSRHPREVIAVYEDFPDNSSVHNGAITDIGEHFLNRTSNWMYNYLVKLDSPDHMEETRQAIIAGLKTLRPDVKAEVFEKVRLVQLHELYFSPEFQSMFRGNRATVYSLLTIAILIVVIAMINFINFSVALVPLRIRNINTQKVLGRPTPALRCDTVLEAAGTALISFLLAIPLIQWFAASPLAGITPINLCPVQNLPLLALTGTMALSAGVIAGLYPAWYSTSFPPALVLKGAFGLSPKGRRIRTGLIAFQYFISIVLIIAAISIQAQNRFLKSYDVGFSRDNILVAPISAAIAGRYHSFGDRLKSNPAIRDVTFTDRPPVGSDGSSWGSSYRGRQIQFNAVTVSPNFIDFMGLHVVEGRAFTEADERKSACSLIFNQTAQRQDSLITGSELLGIGAMPIVGIVQDYNFKPLHAGIEPMALIVGGTEWGKSPNASKMRYALIKTSLADVGQASAFVKRTIREFDPLARAEVNFLDEFIGNQYQKETNLSRQLILFSLLSILIALIGVFGLVLFETQYRRREIAVRKVFGATIPAVLAMFNKSMIRIVLVCFLIAAPTAWYIVHRWLEGFAYKFRMGFWIFLLALAIVLLITVLTVTLQSYKAATENPAQSIKTD